MISRDVKFFGEKSSVTEPNNDVQIDPTNPTDTNSDKPISQPETITESQIRKSARGQVPKKQWPVALANTSTLTTRSTVQNQKATRL
jgi:hypothetical protein